MLMKRPKRPVRYFPISSGPNWGWVVGWDRGELVLCGKKEVVVVVCVRGDLGLPVNPINKRDRDLWGEEGVIWRFGECWRGVCVGGRGCRLLLLQG